VRPLAVFDLDGVLADVEHRVHHLDRWPPDWAAFFAAAPGDPVHPEGVAMVHEAAASCEIAYLTGRPERCRDDTLRWLGEQGLPSGRLVMRRDRDHRPARRAKPELLQRLAEGREVAVVVDDDDQVCRALVAAGWPVLQATWADRSARLEQAQEEEGRT
jgi:phosphoglycolate phosphatase-like HAD superfamily hydrolase